MKRLLWITWFTPDSKPCWFSAFPNGYFFPNFWDLAALKFYSSFRRGCHGLGVEFSGLLHYELLKNSKHDKKTTIFDIFLHHKCLALKCQITDKQPSFFNNMKLAETQHDQLMWAKIQPRNSICFPPKLTTSGYIFYFNTHLFTHIYIYIHYCSLNSLFQYCIIYIYKYIYNYIYINIDNHW